MAGLGVLALIAAPLIKWVAAPALVKVPLDVHLTTVATGTSQVFVLSRQAVETVPVVATRTVTGDKAAGTGSVAVFDEVLCLRSATSGAGPVDKFGCVLSTDPAFIERTVDRIAFNRKTGLAVADPGRFHTAVDGDSTIAHVGLGYTFPIDTRKISYPFFDPVAGHAFPMQYQSTQRLDGLTVYEFQQRVPASPIKINGLLPGTYSDLRTVWVEPTTGVIIKGSEAISQTFTQGGMTAFKGTLVFDDASVSSQAKFAESQLTKIRTIRLYLPVGALVVGLALLIGAGALMRGRRSTVAERADHPVGSSHT